MSNLKEIGGFFQIFENNKLSNLDGLDGLSIVDGYVSIEDNISLNDFCSIIPLLSGGSIDMWTFSIEGNEFNPTIQSILAGNCSQ